MRQDTQGEVLNALKVAKNQGKLGGYPYDMGATVGSGRVHVPFLGDIKFGASTVATGTLWAMRWIAPYNMTIDALVIENAGAGDTGEKCRIGIYAESAAGLPGALLAEAAEITLGAAVDVNVSAITPFAVTAGTAYWLAFTGNATTNWGLVSAATTISSGGFGLMMHNVRSGFAPWAADLPALGTALAPFLAKTHVYGALPNPFGSPTSAADVMPLIGVRED
jgi:hypothetical protein